MTDKQKRTKELHQFFKKVWDKREDEDGNCYCYETGRQLPFSHFRQNTCCYSHCFPKSKYPELEFEESNILIVHPDIHAQWESNPDKTPKMKKYFENLKEKLGNIKTS